MKIGQALTVNLRAGYKSLFVAQGSGAPYGGVGGIGSFFRLLPGSGYDYRAEAGWLHDNSIVLTCINWAARTMMEAPLVVQRQLSDGSFKTIAGHPLEAPLRRPNTYYDRSTLWAGTLLSEMTDGNSYWYRLQDRAGRTAGFQYLPHFLVQPKNDKNNDAGTKLITYYQYSVEGRQQEIDPEDIVHFRHGIDPLDPRRGLNPVGAALREVCTDNEAATYQAAMLRNMGVPGCLISPKEGEGRVPELTPADRQKIVALWGDKFRGDRRGEPLVAPMPIEVTPLGFNPEQMIADKASQRPEERIPALYGISPMVLGLGAGLERSTFTNYREAREAAYESFVIPTQDRLAEQATEQLEEELGAGERIGWDRSNVRALQDDVDKLYVRLEKAAGGPFLTVNEARQKAGMNKIDGGDELRQPRPALPDADPKEAPAGKKSLEQSDWAERVVGELLALDEGA